MSTIRPPHPSALPAAPQGPQGPARHAAQKAFFEAALGRTAPTQTQAQTLTQAPTQTLTQTLAQSPTRGAARATQVAEVQVSATAGREIPQPVRSPDEAPQKILRPGSLLDIRV